MTTYKFTPYKFTPEEREEIKQRAKSEISCKEFLRPAKNGGNICPYCGSGTHKNFTGAFHWSKQYNTCKCEVCGKTADSIDLFIKENNLEGYNEAIPLLAEKLNYTPKRHTERPTIDLKQNSNTATPKNTKTNTGALRSGIEALEVEPINLTGYYKQCNKNLNTDSEAQAYLTSRGLSLETANSFLIGYDPQADPAGKGYYSKRLIIPSSKEHYIARAIENVDPKYKKMNNVGAKSSIFNLEALYGEATEIFIVEGAIDALSIIEVEASAIGLNSTNNKEKLIKALEE